MTQSQPSSYGAMVSLTRIRDTRNFAVFAPDDEEHAAVGKIYVRRYVCEQMGNPSKLTLALTPA